MKAIRVTTSAVEEQAKGEWMNEERMNGEERIRVDQWIRLDQ
jgi:hypothetical protein